MSKNFELLHIISNEKELFQTLDAWEGSDEASVKTGPEADIDGEARARTQQQSLLAVELEFEPETLPSAAIPESQQASETAASSSVTEVQELRPAKEEKTDLEPPRRQAFRSFGVDGEKSVGKSRARSGRTRSVYKDPKREAIAHEEELKLVQRIFLAEEN